MKGPLIVSDWMCGRPVQSSVSAALFRNGRSRAVSATAKFSTNAIATSCGPALDRQPQADPRVDGVGGVGWLLERGGEVVVSSDRRRVHPPSVDGDFDVVGMLEAAQVAEVGPIQLDLEGVLAVERKHVADQQPADRTQRQSLEMPVLRKILTDPVGVAGRTFAGIANRQRADFFRGGQIALLQRRRDAQHVGDVVEAVGGVIGRQQRRDVHIHARGDP